MTDTDLFTPPETFMGMPSGRPGRDSKAAILGVPFDCGIHPFRIGSRGGPDAVRGQSRLIRRYNPTYADFDIVERLGAVDCGNVSLTPSRMLDAFARIEAAASRIVETGAVPITIGGDGSISVPLARAVAKRHPDLVALHIDSHTDAYPYDPADKYNAATQFTHIAEEGLVDASSSWHVGIRGTTYCEGIVERTESFGFGVVSLDTLVRRGFGQTMAEFKDLAGRRPVYLCWDMDVFDPSVAPGVCSPTWGGLTAREGIDLMRSLDGLNLVAIDFNTVSPPHDVNHMTAHLCAHMIYEAMVLLAKAGIANDRRVER